VRSATLYALVQDESSPNPSVMAFDLANLRSYSLALPLGSLPADILMDPSVGVAYVKTTTIFLQVLGDEYGCIKGFEFSGGS
jgi:hypothetical protein